jgi:hypothetical protein
MPSPEHLALVRRIDTLEGNLQRQIKGNKAYPINTFSKNSDTVDCVVAGSDITDNYSVVIVYSETGGENLLPKVEIYTEALATSKESSMVGVVVTTGAVGQLITVQISGASLVRVKPGDGSFVFNDTSTGAIRAGSTLKVNDSGQVELDLAESDVRFIAVEAQNYNVSDPTDPITNDDVIQCVFFTPGGSSTYGGPWKLNIDTTDDTKVSILEDGDLTSRITIGNVTGDYSAKQSVIISQNSFIYIEFTTQSDGTIMATSTASWPEDENGTMKWVIGEATWGGSAVTAVTQYHYGNINIPARVGL